MTSIGINTNRNEAPLLLGDRPLLRPLLPALLPSPRRETGLPGGESSDACSSSFHASGEAGGRVGDDGGRPVLLALERLWLSALLMLSPPP